MSDDHDPTEESRDEFAAAFAETLIDQIDKLCKFVNPDANDYLPNRYNTMKRVITKLGIELCDAGVDYDVIVADLKHHYNIG